MHDIRVLELDRPNGPLLHKLGFFNNSPDKYSGLKVFHLRITNKLVTVGQLGAIMQRKNHLSRLVVEILPVDFDFAYECLHAIKNCDELLLQYGVESIRIDFRNSSIRLSDAAKIGLAQHYESLQFVNASIPNMDEEFQKQLGELDYIFARTKDVHFSKVLTATRRTELALTINDEKGDIATYFECRKYISINVLYWPAILALIPPTAESLVIFYKAPPTVEDMDILLALRSIKEFTMTETIIVEDMPFAPERNNRAPINAHSALITLLAKFDANEHWPNLQSFSAFMPALEHLVEEATLFQLAPVKDFINEMPVLAKREILELLFIKKLRALFDLESLNSFELNFDENQWEICNALQLYLDEVDIFGWKFETVGSQIVGTKVFSIRISKPFKLFFDCIIISQTDYLLTNVLNPFCSGSKGSASTRPDNDYTHPEIYV